MSGSLPINRGAHLTLDKLSKVSPAEWVVGKAEMLTPRPQRKAQQKDETHVFLHQKSQK